LDDARELTIFRHISEHEIRLLCALKEYGDQPNLPSNQRIRLEMLGLVIDGPCGIRLTEKGESLARRTVLPSWVTVTSAISDLAKWNDTEGAGDVEEELSDALELMPAEDDLANDFLSPPPPPRGQPIDLQG